MKIIYPDIEKLIEYHKNIINIWLEKWEWWSFWFLWWKNKTDLESIINFIESDLYYPTLEEKITQLFFSINKNHIFTDWNKRSSIAFSAYFLSLNIFDNSLITKYIRELEDITVQVADNKISKDLLLKIISSIINYNDDYNEEIKLEIYNSIK